MVSENHTHNSVQHPVDSTVSQESSDPLSVIGISLVSGFIFMLVVDQVSD